MMFSIFEHMKIMKKNIFMYKKIFRLFHEECPLNVSKLKFYIMLFSRNLKECYQHWGIILNHIKEALKQKELIFKALEFLELYLDWLLIPDTPKPPLKNIHALCHQILPFIFNTNFDIDDFSNISNRTLSVLSLMNDQFDITSVVSSFIYQNLKKGGIHLYYAYMAMATLTKSMSPISIEIYNTVPRLFKEIQTCKNAHVVRSAAYALQRIVKKCPEICIKQYKYILYQLLNLYDRGTKEVVNFAFKSIYYLLYHFLSNYHFEHRKDCLIYFYRDIYERVLKWNHPSHKYFILYYLTLIHPHSLYSYIVQQFKSLMHFLKGHYKRFLDENLLLVLSGFLTVLPITNADYYYLIMDMLMFSLNVHKDCISIRYESILLLSKCIKSLE